MDKILLGPKDIGKILRVSKPTSYKVIKELNAELRESNKIIFNSKIYRSYFSERYYGEKFLKSEEIQNRFDLKEWETSKICKEIKDELLEKGFKFIKGRIPEKYLLEKLIV